jgi:Sec-independent protein translocase protein TatA
MKLCAPFRKLGMAALALCSAALLFLGICNAAGTQQAEQQQSQQPPPPTPPAPAQDGQPSLQPPAPPEGPAVKKKKVWTNDDVIALRTPGDQYQVEKEEKEAAEAAAAAKEAAMRAAAKSEKQPPLDIKLPDTVEETGKMLKDTQDDIQEVTVVLDKMRKEFPDVPEEQQPGKQKEIDRLTATLVTLRRNAQALQDHLVAITPKPEPENPPPSPSSL